MVVSNLWTQLHFKCGIIKLIFIRDPADEAPQANDLNTPTSKAVEAYPHSRSVIATLSFLVPTICLLSCIPAGLAWSHTPSTVGAYNDGNFYQLVSSSAMQLLGIGTLIWPTLFSTRLSRTSWIWSCVLTGTGIICRAGWFHFVGMWLRLWSCYSLCRVSRTNVERCNAVACGLGTFEIPGDASLVSWSIGVWVNMRWKAIRIT